MGNNTETKNVQLNIGGDAANVLDALKKRAKDLADQMQKAMSIGDTQALTKLRRSYHQTLTEIGNMTTKQEQFNTALKNMNLVDMKELLRLQKQIQNVMLSGAVTKGSKEWKEYEKQLGQVNRQILKIKTEMDSAGQGGLSKMLSMVTGSSNFGGIAGGLGKIGGKLLAIVGVTTSLVNVLKDAFNINKQFEQQQANLASVLGKTRSEITELTRQAKLLGETTLYTASEVSGLQINLAKLGFKENEIKEATRPVLDFALATGAQLPEAASVAGAALRAFGLDASQMERVVSTMAVATTKSALDFEKLRTSISITFPVAKAFGFTIEDTVTLLAKLADAGFEASSAATATRNILLNMANPAGRLAKALGRPITSVNELGEAFAELKERNISLAEAFALTDKRSVSAFTRFVEVSGQLDSFKNSITDCDEGLRKMVDERMNTLQGSITILNSAWQGLMLTFSESNGVLKDITDFLAEMVRDITEFFSTVDENSNRRITIGTDEEVRQRKAEWGSLAEEIEQFGEIETEWDNYDRLLDKEIKKQTELQAKLAKTNKDLETGNYLQGTQTNSGANLFKKTHEQLVNEQKQFEADLIETNIAIEKYQYMTSRLGNKIEQKKNNSTYDKDAMKKQRLAIENEMKQAQLDEENRYLEVKSKFEEMSYEEQEAADKEHWEKMYNIEIDGYKRISALYSGNNDQLEKSYEGRAIVSERKLADKLFSITQQYAKKDEKDVLERERMRIKTGREELEAAKANAVAQANYEYEQFVLAGGKKDDAKRKLNEDLLKADQAYYKGLNTLYASDIKETAISNKTKAKLREQYDAEALRALAEKSKKESEYNKKITDEVLKSEDELRKMTNQFDKQNKIDIFVEADAKLSAKKYELNNMLSLYDDYFHNLLQNENLTAEERLAIEKLYENKVKQINEQLKNWENLNTKERYTAMVDVVGKAMDEVKNLMSSVTTLVNQGYETQIAKVEARYDDEIAAAEKAGKDTTALEEAKENEVKQIQMKQAKSDMNASIAQIQIDTAMAIAKAWAGNPYLAAVMTALITANMAIQTATVKKQYEAKMASLGQYYEGGYTGSIESSDRRYHRVAGVVHDGEFVANHNAVNNPSVRPVLDAIDYAQRNNTIASMTRDDVALAAGFANGGYTSRPGAVASTMASDSAIARLNAILGHIEQNGIVAQTYVQGRGGINRAQAKASTLTRNKSRITS